MVLLCSSCASAMCVRSEKTEFAVNMAMDVSSAIGQFGDMSQNFVSGNGVWEEDSKEKGDGDDKGDKGDKGDKEKKPKKKPTGPKAAVVKAVPRLLQV